MNLPEGFQMQMLQEQFGPRIGADPISLLSVVGRQMIGRVQVAVPGATLDQPPQAEEVRDILQGDNSEEAFAELVRQHASSGVSGVVPKFLDGEIMPPGFDVFNKATFFTGRHIIKGSSRQMPFAALNEHFCMTVARRVMPAAKTEVSADGKALVVHRFDIDEKGRPACGMEDFCVLLGLRSANKYDTTWERIAKAVADYVPGHDLHLAYRQMAKMLILTYALRNADCLRRAAEFCDTGRSNSVTSNGGN
jgi:serine/threonine-protein kinase HipA